MGQRVTSQGSRGCVDHKTRKKYAYTTHTSEALLWHAAIFTFFLLLRLLRENLCSLSLSLSMHHSSFPAFRRQLSAPNPTRVAAFGPGPAATLRRAAAPPAATASSPSAKRATRPRGRPARPLSGDTDTAHPPTHPAAGKQASTHTRTHAPPFHHLRLASPPPHAATERSSSGAVRGSERQACGAAA